MTTKHLFTKVNKVKCDQLDNQTIYFDLEYYITESFLRESNRYGIEIVKTCTLNSKESILFEDIYCNRKDAENMATKLTENAVTPVSLTYVLEDTIGI